MKNKFEDAMSNMPDEKLQKITSSIAKDYEPEAVKAAEQEILKREFIRVQFSKYSDEQIIEITKSENEFQSFDVEVAHEEIKKRNLKPEIDGKKGVHAEMQNMEAGFLTKKHPALKFISTIYRILAWFIAIVAIILSLYFLLYKEDLWVSIAILIGGGILFVALFSTAEVIKVFTDIEHNTRITAINSKK